MMNMDGAPYVIEYNVRMGDPETESVLPRLESDLVDLLQGVAQGNLADRSFTLSSKTAATVVLVSGGYPGPYERSEEHTSELQSLMRISYAVFCLKKKKQYT